MKLAMLLAVLVAWTAAAQDSTPFRFTKTLTPPEEALGIDAVLAADLDSEVYAAVRDDLGDLRVFAADGEEVPYVLERRVHSRSETVRDWHDATLEELEEAPDNRIAVTFRISADAPPLRGMRLETPLVDFERQVRIFGRSNPEDDWAPLVEEALMFDYRRFADVRRLEVPVPAGANRWFRVEVLAVTDEQASALTELTRTLVNGQIVEEVDRTHYRSRPFRIDRLRWWSESVRQRGQTPMRADYPLELVGIETDPDAQETVIDLRSRREPLTSLTLESPRANFSRPARVLVPDDGPAGARWRTLGQGTLRRIAFRELRESALTVSFPETRSEAYRLVIENRDSPELEVAGVIASGVVHRVLFLAQGGEPYELRYGESGTGRPRYDEDAVWAPVRAGYAPIPVAVGPQRESETFQPSPRGLADALNSPASFVAVVAVAVAVLAWLLFGLGRRAADLPDDGEYAPPAAQGSQGERDPSTGLEHADGFRGLSPRRCDARPWRGRIGGCRAGRLIHSSTKRGGIMTDTYSRIPNRFLWMLVVVLLLAVGVQGGMMLRMMNGRDAKASEPADAETQVQAQASPWSGPDPVDPWQAMDEWDPFTEMRRMHERMNRLFEDSFNRFQARPDFSDAWGDLEFAPSLDLRDGGDAYVLRKELRRGQFHRSVTLPGPVKAEAMAATYDNGVLTIRVPKGQESPKAQRIDVL